MAYSFINLKKTFNFISAEKNVYHTNDYMHDTRFNYKKKVVTGLK